MEKRLKHSEELKNQIRLSLTKRTMEINNDFLTKMDIEAGLMLMDVEYGGTGQILSEISFLEFRKRLYKKYYNKEQDALDS